MAREFKGKLSAEDIAYLRSRHPMSYVNRMIDLYGAEKGADDVAKAEKEAEKARKKAEKAAREADEAAAKAQAEADAAAAVESTKSDQAAGAGIDPALDEDLIGTGTGFDVLKATEAEVKTWSETASDEAKAEALAAEQGREDRDPRKGVVALLS